MEFVLTGYMLGEFEKKLAPLQKRAAKLGLPPVTVKVLATEMLPATRDNGTVWFYKKHTVDIEGAEPKVGDFEFAATLDNRETGTILRKCPTFEGDLPERFRNADKTCDHCKKARHRTEVFVLKNLTDGTFVQVGRQCIKDFLGGVDPVALAKLLEEWAALEAYIEEGGEGGDDFRFGGGGVEAHVTAQEVLQETAKAIRMYGWLARSAGFGYATADRVARRLFEKDEPATNGLAKTPVYYDEKWTGGAVIRETNSGLGNLEATDADKALAAGVLAHIAGLPGKSDFEHNLKTLCHPGLEFVKAKDVGMVAAAVMVYERFLGNEAKYRVERERKAKLQTGDAWVGEIGKRMTGELTFVDKKLFDGDYGVRTLVKMVDADGNDITWWTGDTDFGFLKDVERGANLGLCAFTPKKHEEYNGKKQTVVTRVAPAPAKAVKKTKVAA